MNKINGLTRSELMRETGCKNSTIEYLLRERKLICNREPCGKGSIALYSEKSIAIIEEHLAK